MMLQPNQNLFTVADGWAWLANMVNYCGKVSNPPFYFLSVLNVFLRIVTPVLDKTYGSRYQSLLNIIEQQILPIFEKKDESYMRIEDFFIKYKAKEDFSFFQ